MSKSPQTSQNKASKEDTPTVDIEELARQVEAALMVTDRSVSTAKLSEMLDNVGTGAITEAIESLNSTYEQTNRSFRLEQVAGGWQILTLPQYADVLTQMQKTKVQNRLSPAALETLTIIAYKQPILRADIEAIRGVAAGEVIRSLLERHLVKIVGRAEEIGRPMLYGTTKYFLEVFGLASLKDLPNAEQLRIPSYQAKKEQDIELEEEADDGVTAEQPEEGQTESTEVDERQDAPAEDSEK